MRRILIANRGEIACRIIRSCKQLGIEAVAVYSEADANSLHVSLADVAVPIGAPAPSESYGNAGRIIEAARQTAATGIHPGYGFLAENHDFAGAVERAGLIWIGPDPKTIEDMGDKERARLLAKSAGVPILPGSSRIDVDDSDGIEEAAAEVGYPLLVKAAAGGGGIGMRRVERAADLRSAVEATQSMAKRAFGDGTVYFERFIATARHVEVQVFGYGDGHAIHMYERDCSVQRRFQKVIEESPAPKLSEATRHAMFDAAVSLCKQERYRSAGTIEFVVDASTEQFYFLEMNTRIQVEHPVTEMTTGVDLVAMQIQLAAGQRLSFNSQDEMRRDGHALECRIYAERPAKGFLPSPGLLSTLRLPDSADGVRIDTGIKEGDRITPFYDPMIAKVITHGVDRNAAIERMLATLESIELKGVETNIVFLRKTLAHPDFQDGRVRTDFLDQHRAALL